MQERRQGHTPRAALIGWLGTTLFCAFFSFVYAQFSHGVYSPFMTYLAAIPLAGGLIEFALQRLGASSRPSRALLRCGVATLAIASCLRGVFEIAGTASAYLPVYVVVGVGLLVASAAMSIRAARATR